MNIHILCMLLELVSQLAYLFSDLIIKRAKLLIFVLQGSGRAVTLLLVSSPDDNKPYQGEFLCERLQGVLFWRSANHLISFKLSAPFLSVNDETLLLCDCSLSVTTRRTPCFR